MQLQKSLSNLDGRAQVSLINCTLSKITKSKRMNEKLSHTLTHTQKHTPLEELCHPFMPGPCGTHLQHILFIVYVENML